MSAYVCSDKHIATIAAGYVRLVGDPNQLAVNAAAVQVIADRLLAANIRSVNYRYKEDSGIVACDCSEAEDRPLADLLALVRCWDYQACERPDWDTDPANYLGQNIYATIQANLAIRGKKAVPNENLWSI